MKQLPSRLLKGTTLTVEDVTGESSFGTVYGIKKDIPARVEKKQKVNVFPTGSVIIYDIIVYTNIKYAITDKAKVTLDTVVYEVADIQPYDEVYQKLFLRKAQ